MFCFLFNLFCGRKPETGRRILLIICFFLAAGIQHPSSLSASEPAELGEITVTAEHEASQSEEAPSSFVTIIEPDEQNSNFETVSDLISSGVGTTSKSMSGLGQFSTVSIRGSNPEQVAVFLDGVKMNPASSGMFDFSTIPVDSIERIEVVRGGGTTQFGSDAIGGVINIITKAPQKGRRFEAYSGGGSFWTFKLGGSYEEKFERDSVTLALRHMQSKGNFKFKTNDIIMTGSPSGNGGGQVFTRIHNSFVSESILAKWGKEISGSTRFDLINDFFFTKRDVPGTEEETTLLYPANPLDAEEWIFRNTSSATFNISPFLRNNLKLMFGATGNFDVDMFNDPTPALGNPINIRTNDFVPSAFVSFNAAIDNKYVQQFITLRDDFHFHLLTDSSKISRTQLIGTKKRQVESILFQDELSLLDERIVLLPAFRYEYVSDFSGDISYKGGIKIRPHKIITLKGNFERSFRFPSFNELYYPDQGYIRGNPDLQKEKAANVDGGIEIGNAYISAEITYFHNWIANTILFVPISAFTIAPVNTGAVRTRGVECGVTIDPIKYIHVGANYTFLDAYYKDNGYQLPGRPKHEVDGRVEFIYDWATGNGLTLFGNYNFKSEFPINTSNTVYLDSTSTFDTGLNFRFKKNYYATISANNITNVQTYDSRGFPLPRRSVYGTVGTTWN